MPRTLPWSEKTEGVPAVLIRAFPPDPWAYTNGMPWPMVVRRVRVPSDQYGVTVQSDQASALASGEFSPVRPTVRSRLWANSYCRPSPTIAGVVG